MSLSPAKNLKSTALQGGARGKEALPRVDLIFQAWARAEHGEREGVVGEREGSGLNAVGPNPVRIRLDRSDRLPRPVRPVRPDSPAEVFGLGFDRANLI